MAIPVAATARPVVVVADGDVDAAQLVRLLAEISATTNPALVIAADGAAGKALDAGVRPDLVIGDGDSLTANERARLEAAGIELRIAATDKDESDTELCLLEALASGARQITLVGALGGDRPEHTIANLLLLADARFDACRIWLVAGAARMTRIGTVAAPGELAIEGQAGDFVSLLPLGCAVEGVTTSGLRFQLQAERLELGPTRGLSNEMLASRARIATRSGRLMVVHTARTP